MWGKKYAKAVSTNNHSYPAELSKSCYKNETIAKPKARPKVIKLYETCMQLWRVSNDAVLLLTWSSIIHIFGSYPVFLCAKLTFKYIPNLSIYLCLWRALLYLLYPLFNYFGECCWSRYKVMILGTVLSLLGVCMSGPGIALIFRSCLSNLFTDDRCLVKHSIVMVTLIGLIIYYIGVSLFEANSIPFGMDQLHSKSKRKTKIFLTLYVSVVYLSKYGGLPLVYLLISLGSSHLYVCLSLIPIFCLIIFSHEYKGSDLNVRTTHNTTSFKLLRNYLKNFCSFLCNSLVNRTEDCPKQTEDVIVFNQMFNVFMTLIGCFLMQSNEVPNNVFFIFDDDLLISNRLYYFVSTEILQTIPIFAIVFFIFWKKSFLFNTSAVKILLFGLFLSVVTLILLSICNFEISAAYTYNRSLHPNLSATLLLTSFIKGVSSLMTFLSILDLIFLHTPHNIQGSLLAFFNCYQAIPLLFFLYTNIQKNVFFVNCVLLPIETIVAVIGMLVFVKLKKERVAVQTCCLPKINKSSNNLIV